MAETPVFESDHHSFGLDSTKGDERLAVRFFKKAARDDLESEKQARMVFKEVDFVQIMVPGDRDNILIRPAGEGDKRRFAKQYEAFQRGESEAVVGTPLELWGKLTLPQVEELRYIGVRTIEQLAELRDDAVMKMPGALDLKRRAAAFIELQREEAPLRKVQAELEQRDKTIADLTARLDALEQSKASAVTAPPPLPEKVAARR